MRRSIFQRHKHPKLADRLRPVGADPMGLTKDGYKTQNGTATTGKKLTGKNLRIGAIITLIAGAVAWMSQKQAPSLPITEQALTLPNSTASKTTTTIEQAPTIPTRAPSAPLPPINAIPVTHPAPNTAHAPLTQANAQAILAARNGDPQAAVSLLEAALINDPTSGILFDNLRKLYAGFATQSYQLAIDPNKNQAVLVELNDAQQKYTVQIPVMTSIGNRAALAKIDTLKTMPTLPQANLPTTLATETSAPATKTEIITSPTTSTIPSIQTTPPVISVPAAEPAKLAPPAPSATERKEINAAVMQALKNWSDAWSKQDVDAYLASYQPTYAPKGTTHKEWADYRRIRLNAPKFVKIELSDQKAILTDATHVRVSFTQSYTSDTLRAKDKKTLELELIDNTWLIISESGR